MQVSGAIDRHMTRPDAGRKRNQIRRALKMEERDYGAIVAGAHSDSGESEGGERREIVQLGSAEAVREFWGLSAEVEERERGEGRTL